MIYSIKYLFEIWYCILIWHSNQSLDCTDESDETTVTCISFQCSDSEFQCAYGACVDRTAECDGVRNCADNSGNSTVRVQYENGKMSIFVVVV